MMLRNFASLSFVFGLAILASGVSNEVKYVYEDSPECRPANQFQELIGMERPSALSGFPVGPNAPLLAANGVDQPIIRPFTSDGCSSSPVGVPLTKDSTAWLHCCVKHDVRYWVGGTEEEKAHADNELESCIGQAGYPNIGQMYKVAVSSFGGPMSTQSYRWGYGWNYKRPFRPLSDTEKKQVEVLYHVSFKASQDLIFSNTSKLRKMCDTYDPVFYGMSPEEKVAYQFLNAAINRDDQIEWAQWDVRGLSQKVLRVKVAGINAPVQFLYASGTQELKTVRFASDESLLR